MFKFAFKQERQQMQIISKCPKCGNPRLLDSSAADRRITCPKCRKLYKVPKLDELTDAAKILNQAKGTVYVDKNGKTYG